ncbi:hypothetical protein GGR55DRAFT_627907 [Xylaria sp. FL0064]|nr:hypothetical protein GGR55DRAFT_627907 [Xylaria sp. FL0064]
MEDKKSELLQYAREYATANKDLYELLSVSADAAQPEVHRAWRKASLKHHPDKSKVFDPEIWQLFERARDVLSSPEARSAYDAARAAAVQAQKARAALDAKRRAMIDDLEARERGVKRKVGEEGMDGRHMMTAAEKRALMEKGREHLEKRRRMKEEAEAREREREIRRMKEDGDGYPQPRKPERRPTQPSSAHIPTPSASASANTVMEDIDTQQTQPPPDEYDERIADIERRLRERKAEKAARKAGKKSNKARRDGSNHITADEHGDATTTDPTTTTTTRTTPPLAATTEKPAPLSTSIPKFPTTTTTQQPQPQPLKSNPTPGDFSSTMAKLRAAQREKERKRTEAAAAAATAASDG